MACVPGGWFVRGQDDGPPDRRPRARVWLQTFLIDKTEVTFAAYQACVAAGKCRRKGPWYNDFSRPRQPIVGVSWFDARTYCRSVGKRLPTEAEWEKAARGPDGDRFPWGNEKASCERAVIEDASGRSCGVKKKPGRGPPHKGRTFEVASKPAGRYGLFDMAGNAWEWVADWYDPKGYGPETIDPKGPCKGADRCPPLRRRVVRGGSWYWDGSKAEGSNRRFHHPLNRKPYGFHHFGFRCASARPI